MISILTQVEQVRHRQNSLHLCHFLVDFLEDLNVGTGGTGKISPIAHARARVVLFLSLNVILFFRNIWIILKNTCSTCDKSEMFEVSPVPTACSSLFHLCQAGG